GEVPDRRRLAGSDTHADGAPGQLRLRPDTLRHRAPERLTVNRDPASRDRHHTRLDLDDGGLDRLLQVLDQILPDGLPVGFLPKGAAQSQKFLLISGEPNLYGHQLVARVIAPEVGKVTSTSATSPTLPASGFHSLTSTFPE